MSHRPIMVAANEALQAFVHATNVTAGTDRLQNQGQFAVTPGKRVVRVYCTHESAMKLGFGNAEASAAVSDIPLAPGENIFGLAENVTHLTFFVSDAGGYVTISEMA